MDVQGQKLRSYWQISIWWPQGVSTYRNWEFGLVKFYFNDGEHWNYFKSYYIAPFPIWGAGKVNIWTNGQWEFPSSPCMFPNGRHLYSIKSTDEMVVGIVYHISNSKHAMIFVAISPSVETVTIVAGCCIVPYIWQLWPLLLTWIHFNPTMDK